MNDEFDYRKEIIIDPDDLDKELINQAALSLKYSDAYADATYERDKAKRALKVLRAQEGVKIRTFDPKLSDAKIEALVECEKHVSDAEFNLIELQHRVAQLGGAVAAFTDRRKMLESLVSLYLTGYWSENATSKHERKEAERQRVQELKNGLKDVMNREGKDG